MDSSSEASIASAMAGANTTGSTETEDDGIAQDLDRAFDQHSGIETPSREVTSDELKAERPETTTERAEGDDLDKDIARSLDKVAPETRSAGHDSEKWRQQPAEARQQAFRDALRKVNRPMVEDLREEALRQGDFAAVDMMDGLLFKSRQAEVFHFAEEKGPDGKLLRPYMDDVALDVAALIRASKEDGRNLSLAQAYDMAVWANPKTREKVEVDQLKAMAAANKVAPKVTKPQPDSLDRDLRANWDKAA